jgi:hypothetical protein
MPNRTAPKTPYEIRLELLELARTVLQSQYDANTPHESKKTAPTTEQIVAEAEKMNAFISKANNSNQSH